MGLILNPLSPARIHLDANGKKRLLPVGSVQR